MRNRTKSEFIRLFSGLKNKPITDGMMRDLIKALWPSSVNLTGMLLYYLPRANEESLQSGVNEIEYLAPFPEGVEYVLKAYTFNTEGNFQVGNTIVEDSQTLTGFSISVKNACTLIYNAIPKK